VVGDRDGVVIVPAEAVEEAVTKTEHVMATESDMRQAIIDGMDPEKAYLKFGMF
jgi:regulator of RNase E activity RraA